MAPEPRTLSRLSRLLADTARDAEALDARHAELRGQIPRWTESPTRADLVVAAVDVHAWYTGLETLLERVARLLDEDVPTGPAWHAELLAQMRVEVPAVRPAVLPEGAVPDLEELRKFRHFFRNAYAVELDAELVRAQAERVLAIHAEVASALRTFTAHLEAVRDACG